MGRVAALVVLIAVALAGCGGDDSSGDTPLQRQPTTAVAQIPPDLTLTPKDAKRVAQAGVLRAEDFPPGWTSKPDEDDEDDDTKCKDIDERLLNDSVADLDAPEFDHEAEAVFNSVGVWAKREDAVAAIHALNARDLGDCFVELFGKESDPGLLYGDVTAEELDLGSVGDEATGVALDIPMRAKDRKVTVFLDVAIVRVGNAITLVGYASAFAPPSQTLRNQVIKASVDRLTAAQIAS